MVCCENSGKYYLCSAVFTDIFLYLSTTTSTPINDSKLNVALSIWLKDKLSKTGNIVDAI